MCEPASIALAISAASTAFTYVSQTQAAKAQEESTRRAGALQQMDLARQADQQQQQAAEQANEHARAAARDAALFDTVAGEYGGGNSINRAAAVSSVQQGAQLATLNRNAELASQENRFASLATTQNTNARLASIHRPSALGAALTIAGSATSAYQQGAFGGPTKKPTA